jgi:hypothetical protein
MKDSSLPCKRLGLLAGCLLLPLWAHAAAFSSGSTGADGEFSPTASQTIDVPASGVFNYTNVTIPEGVTIRYNKNRGNTPVVILASGAVTIAGAIDVGGGNALAGCDGVTSTGNPGVGGPGGYDGGFGGINAVDRNGSNGQGPGGGAGGRATHCAGYSDGGGGAGNLVAGSNSLCQKAYGTAYGGATGGPAYGSVWLTPLLGGSGGGGGQGAKGSAGYFGTGGGGGGGSLMIVASGKVTLTGHISAVGGNGGLCSTAQSRGADYYSGTGGGGSGGGIRIVASDFLATGTDALRVNGGAAGANKTHSYYVGGAGAPGYIRTEIYNAGTFSFLGTPSLAFAKVAGTAVVQTSDGLNDVELAADTPNPVAIELASSNVPAGTVVKVIVNQLRGASTSFNSSPLAGNMAKAAATASVDIPMGVSTLYAQASFTTTLAMGEALSTYAQGERVDQIRLETRLTGESLATLITTSGKEFAVSPAVLAMAGRVSD